MDFRVLAVGDVVGNPGLEQIRRNLRQMKRQYHADFAVVNGENAAVVGITPNQADSILVAGADIAAFINIGHAANADQTFNQIAAIQLFADQIIHLFPP